MRLKVLFCLLLGGALLMPSLQAQLFGKKDSLVVLHTPEGDITLRLYEETPIHRSNFLKLAQEGFYDSTIFHRIIKDFMVQGGDPYSKNAATRSQSGQGSPGYTLPAEFNPAFFHKRGVLAAARMPDNVNPKMESNGSQFYIVQGKKFSDAELEGAQRRVQQILGPDYTISEEMRKVYQEVGGAPWLDQQYTVFGEVIEGMEVIDKLADLPLRGSRPVEDIFITAEVIVMRKKKITREYGTEY